MTRNEAIELLIDFPTFKFSPEKANWFLQELEIRALVSNGFTWVRRTSSSETLGCMVELLIGRFEYSIEVFENKTELINAWEARAIGESAKRNHRRGLYPDKVELEFFTA